MQDHIVKNQRSSDGQSCNDPSPTSQPPKDQQSHCLVLDKFICGGCSLSYHNLWPFLLHKLKHITLSGPLVPCYLCETSFTSDKLAKIHYECFHNVRLEKDQISPVVGHDGSFSSENVQHTAVKLVEETDKNSNRSMKRKRKRKAKSKLSVKEDPKLICHDTVESAQHIGVTGISNTCSSAQSQTGETVSKSGGRDGESWSPNECQNGNSEHFKATKNASQTKCLIIEGSSAARETIVSDTKNVPPKSGNSSSDARKSVLAKKQISLSNASLAKIKKLASIVSARSVSKETARKIVILCKPDKPGMPLLQTKSITRALIKDHVSSSPLMTGKLASTCLSKSNLEVSIGVTRKMQNSSNHNLVDVNKFERDFLFLLVMRESAGKKLRYMREVYKCLYCEIFEKCCLNLLITHMSECHRQKVFDRCPPEMVSSAKVAESASMVSAEVVSFQEYKTKLFEQKTQDEERKLRLQKEKGLPKHLIGLPCKYCSKRLTTATKLQAHMDRHLNVKRFLCEECGRSFRTWHLLQQHKKDHLNASYGKIKCAFCSFQSGDASAVNNHYRIHPKKLNLCHICGNMYSSMRKHIKVHSLDRPYPCPHKGCTYRFTSEVPCKIHYQVHTAHGQRFSCSKCESQFSRRHHLLRHLTKDHRESIDIQETLCSSQIPEAMQPPPSGLLATDGLEFDQSAEGTEMEEFPIAVEQDSSHISESLQ